MSEHKEGWFIGQDIIRNKDLSDREKLVMAVVSNLHELPKGCMCSNSYIGEQIGVSANSIRQTLIGLRKKGALMPSTAVFPKPIKGRRLVPGVYNSHQSRFQTCLESRLVPVYNLDTDTSNILTKEREDPKPSGKKNRQTPDPDDRKSKVVSCLVADSSYPESRVAAAYDKVNGQLEATRPGSSDEVRNFPLLVLRTLQAEDKALLPPRTYPPREPPRPVSQFSRSY